MWLTDLLTDKRTDRRTDKRVAGGHYCWGVLLWPPQLGLGGKCDKKWKLKNVEKSHHFLTLWPWPLTYDLEKLIRSGHYHYQCVYQIWEQSIPCFLSYRVNTIAGGGRRVAGGGRRAASTYNHNIPRSFGYGGHKNVITWYETNIMYADQLGPIVWRQDWVEVANWKKKATNEYDEVLWKMKHAVHLLIMPDMCIEIFKVEWPFAKVVTEQTQFWPMDQQTVCADGQTTNLGKPKYGWTQWNYKLLGY